eukprot:tig00020603_g11781.t1
MRPPSSERIRSPSPTPKFRIPRFEIPAAAAGAESAAPRPTYTSRLASADRELDCLIEPLSLEAGPSAREDDDDEAGAGAGAGAAGVVAHRAARHRDAIAAAGLLLSRLPRPARLRLSPAGGSPPSTPAPLERWGAVVPPAYLELPSLLPASSESGGSRSSELEDSEPEDSGACTCVRAESTLQPPLGLLGNRLASWAWAGPAGPCRPLPAGIRA